MTRNQTERYRGIVNKITLDRKHKELMAAFSAIDQQVAASAIRFEPPTRMNLPPMTAMRFKGMACSHGKFRFESCRQCGRDHKAAQREYLKIQRMYE